MKSTYVQLCCRSKKGELFKVACLPLSENNNPIVN